MLLVETLVFRADTSRRIAKLDQQVRRNARSQDSDKPADDPISLLLLYDSPAEELQTPVA